MLKLEPLISDGLIAYADHELKRTTGNAHAQAEVLAELAEMLAELPNAILRDRYVDDLARKNSCIKKTVLKEQVKKAMKAADAQPSRSSESKGGLYQLPEGFDADFFHEYGYFWKDDKGQTGYYVRTEKGELRRVGNFIITPLYHKYDIENTRLLQLNNGSEVRTVEIPSKQLTSVDQFTNACIEHGNFLWDADKRNHFRILAPLLNQFPLCYELKTLGWQPEGFWAFSNLVIYKGEQLEFDKQGIVRVGAQTFLSPSASNMTQDVRQDSDLYENDRYLTYKHSPIGFSQWAALMMEVYQGHGMWAICFAVMTVFRDLVKHQTKVPLLYAWGEVQSGKSDFAESIQWLFFSGTNSDNDLYPGFNLNQGTDFAFHNRMERFRNCPNFLNEFDETIKSEWYRALKGAYDGEGREKGRGVNNKTTTQKIHCTVIMAGQYLSNLDDNSVLSRSIPLQFRKVENRTDEQIHKHKNLKDIEEQGLSGIVVELLKERDILKQHLTVQFSRLMKEIDEDIKGQGARVKTRVLKNVCALLAPVYVLMKEGRLKMPWTLDELLAEGKRMVLHIGQLLDETNALSDFWDTIIFLIDTKKTIKHERDYLIEETALADWQEDGKEVGRRIEAKRKVLYIRLKNFQQAYRDHRRGSGGLNSQTLISYLSDHVAYLGSVKHKSFVDDNGARLRSSCYAFDYNMLEVELERISYSDIPGPTSYSDMQQLDDRKKTPF